MSKEPEMKAYMATVKDLESEYGTLVAFARTPGKAIGIALASGQFDGWRWTDLRIHRCKELDDSYRGKDQMDWYNDQDRIDMVSKAGFFCTEVRISECEKCAAKDFCDWYQDWKADNEKK